MLIMQPAAPSADTHGGENGQTPVLIILHQLPVELLLDITDLLPPVDILALRATSRFLRATLKRPVWSNVKRARRKERAARKAFIRRLDRDAFHRLCAAEHGTRRPWRRSGKAVCAACKATHPPSSFTPSQLSRAPEKRTCRGRQGALRACEHVRLGDAETFTTEVCARPPWRDLMLGSRVEPISRHACKVGWCETSFGFSSTKAKVDPESWGRSPAYGEVVWEWGTWLELKRGSGSLSSPACKRWLAYVERAKW